MSKREPFQELAQDPIPLKRWRAGIPTSTELVEAKMTLQHKFLQGLGHAMNSGSPTETLYAFFEDYMKNLYIPMEITYNDKSVTNEFYKTLGQTFERLELEWKQIL
jgi:hypothetical protein